MKKLSLSLLFLTFLLGACSSAVPATDAPTSVPPPGICAYQWAYKDLPELTAEFEQAIKALDASAAAHATAFGEECILTQDLSKFIAMETDFYIQKPVNNLTDFESFGDWISDSMKVVESLPQGLLAGPNPGFVEFLFTKSDTERLIIRVPIQDYREKSSGKSGAELFQLFYQP